MKYLSTNFPSRPANWRVAGPAEDVLNNRLRTGLNSDHVVESPAIRARKSIESTWPARSHLAPATLRNSALNIARRLSRAALPPNGGRTATISESPEGSRSRHRLR